MSRGLALRHLLPRWAGAGAGRRSSHPSGHLGVRELQLVSGEFEGTLHGRVKAFLEPFSGLPRPPSTPRIDQQYLAFAPPFNSVHLPRSHSNLQGRAAENRNGVLSPPTFLLGPGQDSLGLQTALSQTQAPVLSSQGAQTPEFCSGSRRACQCPLTADTPQDLARSSGVSPAKCGFRGAPHAALPKD